MKFAAAYALTEVHLDQYFYEDLRLSINLWLNKEGRNDLAWDDLAKKAMEAKSKAKIWKNWDLDQYCFRDKRPFKLIKEAHDN